MKILIINGHKYYWYSTGKLNCTLFEEIVKTLSENHDIKTTVVEQGYTPEEEAEKYKWADAVIYQNPINWFSVPWILKKYFDEVFLNKIFYTPCKDYGKCGLLEGKKYMFSLTCAANEKDFSDTNSFFDMRSIDDIYIAQHKIHKFCAMEKIETFCIYNALHIKNIERELDRLRFHLNKYFK